MFTLQDGEQIPLVGLGTFQLNTKNDEHLVLNTLDVAIEIGYRLIDTASCYKNESDIGKALQYLYKKHSISREDIYITSKLAPKEMGYDLAIETCMKTLKDLQTDYLDLYLIHWPVKSKKKQKGLEHISESEYRKETWRAFQELQEQGYVKSIGVSNFTEKHLEELFSYSIVKPVVNQVEFHPHLHQKELLSMCRKNNIFFQAYSSLGTGELINNEKVESIAQKHKVTKSQILLKWALQQDIGVLPKSTNPIHLRENFEAFAIRLDEDDIDQLNSLNRNFHYCWDPYTTIKSDNL